MSSPFSRKSQELNLLDSNWLQRRQNVIERHKPSIVTGLSVLQRMGSELLQGKVATDIRIEHHLDMQNTRPAERLGYTACSLIPSLSVERHIPTGRGFSWTPDVALELVFSFTDTYNRPVQGSPHQDRMPTGNVQLQVDARSWGRIADDESRNIRKLGNGSNTWAEYGDRGHSRKGTLVSAVRSPGQLVTTNEFETMLAPLAGHVAGYFKLTGNEHLAAFQTPGNFTSTDNEMRLSDSAAPLAILDIETIVPIRTLVGYNEQF